MQSGDPLNQDVIAIHVFRADNVKRTLVHHGLYRVEDLEPSIDKRRWGIDIKYTGDLIEELARGIIQREVDNGTDYVFYDEEAHP
jgi:hypothetical protein